VALTRQQRRTYFEHDLTVAGLIELLGKFPSDMLVGVDGYEGGTTTFIDVQVKDLTLREEMPSWEGEYQSAFAKTDTKQILVIGRRDR
jgi:hypothetical protein